MSNATSKTQAPELKDPKRSLLSSPWRAVIIVIFLYIFAQVIAIQFIAGYPALKHWTDTVTNNWLTNDIFAQFFYVLLAEALTVALLGLLLYKKYAYFFGVVGLTGGMVVGQLLNHGHLNPDIPIIGIVFSLVFYKLGTATEKNPDQKVSFALIGLVKPKLEDIAYALTGLVIYFPAYIGVATLLSSLIPSFNANQAQQIGFQNPAGLFQYALVFISLVILPPIVEEIVFRGFLFTTLSKKLPVVWAALFTSLLFAAPHLLESGNSSLLWIAGVDTFILSLVLCWLRRKTDRLYAGMGLHALKNFVAFASLYLVHMH